MEVQMDAAEQKNREDTIYDLLRTDILELKLRPGMVISIKDIVEVYNSGRTPVRDALISLSKEGLVTLLPQKGTMVSKINYDKIRNERFMRVSVEKEIMLEFMGICDLKILTDLEMSLDRQNSILKSGDARAFMAEDVYFHSIFYYAVKKGYCFEILANNSGHYNRMRLLVMAEEGIERRIIDQHKELIDAVLAKDTDRLCNILQHHLNRIVSQERRIIQKYPDLFDQEGQEARRETDALGVDFLVETKLKYHA